MNPVRDFVALAVLLALGFGSLAQDPTKPGGHIVGKWDFREKIGDAEAKALVEFTQDGKLLMKLNLQGMELSASGTWKLVDGDTLETTVSFQNQTQTQRSKVKVRRDTLEMTDPQGKVN